MTANRTSSAEMPPAPGAEFDRLIRVTERLRAELDALKERVRALEDPDRRA